MITFRSRLLTAERPADIVVSIKSVNTTLKLIVPGISEAKLCLEHYFLEHIIRNSDCPVCKHLDMEDRVEFAGFYTKQVRK